MFKSFEFFIAFRYLKSKRKEKFISITALFSFIGIMLGVAVLIVVMSVLNGFRSELIDKILGVNSHITIYPKNESKLFYNKIINGLNTLDNIQTIMPVIENQVMLANNEKALGGLIKSIKLNDFKSKSNIFENLDFLDRKEFENFDNSTGIVLGKYLAESLDVYLSDDVKVISPEINTTIIGAIPRSKTYKVIGIFQSGLYDYDNNVAFIPLKMGQIQFNQKNMASSIEINLKDNNLINTTIFDINKILNDLNIQYSLIDWKNANSSLISALEIERNVMFLILFLIIVIASFNIISSLIMLVMDKNKQIALLKTIGVSSNSILKIFFICGSFIGFIGTFLGVGLGVVFAKNIENIRQFLEKIFHRNLFDPTIYFLTKLPSEIKYSDICFIVIISLLLSFLATIYPALKASKTDPVEVLKYE